LAGGFAAGAGAAGLGAGGAGADGALADDFNISVYSLGPAGAGAAGAAPCGAENIFVELPLTGGALGSLNRRSNSLGSLVPGFAGYIGGAGEGGRDMGKEGAGAGA
jgi:hypothetical protein